MRAIQRSTWESFVASDAEWSVDKRQRLFVQNGFRADTLMFPGRDITEFGIVTLALPFFGLMFFTEVASAGLVAM